MILLSSALGLALLVGCNEKQNSDLQSDLDQTGDSASTTLENAKDTAQEGVHDAAQSVADDTAKD
jgi:Tfp pilus assembly protein PilP